MPNQQLKINHVDGLTGLRGLAVIAVIGFHYWEHIFPMGYLGVDVFFIISGYCISSAFYKNRFHKDWTYRFLINRFYRLAPASSIVIFLTLIVAYIFFPESLTRSISAEGLYSLLFLSNYYYFLTIDYFGSESITKPLLHMWSLTTEWQCYALFFLATLFISKRRYFFIFIALLFLLLFFSKNIVYDYAKIDVDYVGAYGLEYYWITPHLLEFSAGAIAFLATTKIRKNLAPQNLFGFILTILIFLLVAIMFGRYLEYSIAIPIISSISISIIFLLGIGIQATFLKNYVITPIGTISYSLYLVHWPILSFSYLINKYHDGSIDFSSDMHRIQLLLIAITISLFLYIYVERPLRYTPITKNVNIFYGLVYLSIIILAYYFFSSNNFIAPVNSPSAQSVLTAEKPPPEMEHQAIAPKVNSASDRQINLSVYGLNEYHKKNYGGAIDWEVNNSVDPTVWSREINAGKERNIILFGDSHARQYAFGFLNKRDSYKKVVYARPKKIMKCEPQEMDFINDFLSGEPKDIYITARWDYYGHLVSFFTTPIGTKEYVPPFNELALFYKDQINDCLSKIKLSWNDNIFIIGSVPEVSNFTALYECQYEAKSISSCAYEEIEKSARILYRRNFNAELKSLLAESFPSVFFVDPFDILCDKISGQCLGIKNNKLLYSDQNHLSLFGSSMFVEKLR
jgi:peptidoglycan/LPS O-acetylase OafA/YrhL